MISFREGRFLSDFATQLRVLRRQGLKVSVIFFEASDEILGRRFSETRRPHPAERGKGVPDAISAERAAMKRIRAQADEVVDTSDHTVHTLRKLLLERFSPTGVAAPMRVQVLSFGHKFGAPRDIELLFDVRHLPNPFFVDGLRALSGGHRRVITYLKSQPEVEETLERYHCDEAVSMATRSVNVPPVSMPTLIATGSSPRNVVCSNRRKSARSLAHRKAALSHL